VLNVFWSVLSFLPISIFCYQFMERTWLYAFGAAGVLTYLVPESLFRYVELSSRLTLYRRLRVQWVNRFVQNGSAVNSLLRRKHPGYRRVRSRANALSVVRASHHQERFHWAMFTFFLLSGVYALAHSHPGWALLILLTNVFFNLYPIWLQQYIRMRLKRSLAYPA
jgi:hypothetical protein